MMQYIYVGLSDLKSMFRYKSSKMAKMSKGGSHSSDIGRGRGHVHTNWDRTLIFGMDISLDLYFHILKKKLRWPPSGPPQGGGNPRIHPPKRGGGHAPPNGARKLIFCMGTGLDLYFHNLKGFWGGGTLDPPRGENPQSLPKNTPKKVGGGARPH